jgi:DnaK suppressor protein
MHQIRTDPFLRAQRLRLVEERRTLQTHLEARQPEADLTREPELLDEALRQRRCLEWGLDRERATGTLKAVNVALAAIAEGTYRQCVECEDEIREKRLKAVPWTRLCLACAEGAER